MKIPNGYPVRTVTEKKYYDEMGQCLSVGSLNAGDEYNLRLVDNRNNPEEYALDYPVLIKGVNRKSIDYGLGPVDYAYKVSFHPLSAEGMVVPSIRRERILRSGVLYSYIRMLLERDFKNSHNGYFVGSDDIDDEWLGLLPHPPGLALRPDMVTLR